MGDSVWLADGDAGQGLAMAIGLAGSTCIFEFFTLFIGYFGDWIVIQRIVFVLAHLDDCGWAGRDAITIDTDKCDGCGECVPACPGAVIQVEEDENDPLNDEPVAKVADEQRKNLKYACASCKPDRHRQSLPCVAACTPGAIAHSW